MGDGGGPRAASWRVVHFTDFGGQIVPLVLGELDRHGPAWWVS